MEGRNVGVCEEGGSGEGVGWMAGNPYNLVLIARGFKQEVELYNISVVGQQSLSLLTVKLLY